MAKTDYKSVDEYIAAQPEAVQGLLEDVRATLRKALPKAQEVISYQIPAYKIDGAGVIYFSGAKRHYALYPASRGLRRPSSRSSPPTISKNTRYVFR